MVLLEYKSGIAAEPNSLLSRCTEARKQISEVVQYPCNSRNDVFDKVSDCGTIIPSTFFERNELPWKGRVHRDVVEDAYSSVDRAANSLVNAVAKDFWGIKANSHDSTKGISMNSKSLIVQDIFNNLIAIKEIPLWAKEEKTSYYHP